MKKNKIAYIVAVKTPKGNLFYSFESIKNRDEFLKEIDSRWKEGYTYSNTKMLV